jgi:hypothetical protein
MPDSLVETAALIRAAADDATLNALEAEELARAVPRSKVLALIATRRAEL